METEDNKEFIEPKGLKLGRFDIVSRILVSTWQERVLRASTSTRL